MTIENFTPVESLLGGITIGLAVTLFLYTTGRLCGISGIAKAFPRSKNMNEFLWRGAFLLGLIGGAFIFTLIKGTDMTAAPVLTQLEPRLFIGAALVGMGTAYGKGCTSGHGICGLSRKSARSFAATMIFMAAGMVTVFFTR
jgi:uncharacterized membrane protein YedE/YeeE